MRERLVTLQDLIKFFLTDLDQKFFSRSFLFNQKKTYEDISAVLEGEFRTTLHGETADELERLSRDHVQMVRHKLSELVKDRSMMHGVTPISVYTTACPPNSLVGSLSLLYAHILMHLGRAHGHESEVIHNHGTLTFTVSPQYLRALSLK